MADQGTIPAYDKLMLPVLRHAAEREWSMADLIQRLASELNLSETARTVLLPGGSTTVIASRVHWAKTYLKKAGLVRQPGRGRVEATDAGRALLNTNPAAITRAMLFTYDSFLAFVGVPSTGVLTPQAPSEAAAPSATPDERITQAISELNQEVQDELLDRLLAGSPAFFERVIVDLLISMGYGGTHADARAQLGGPGDGGVDGVVRQDQLGLERVYLQAKRYQPGNTVGAEAVRGFIGALYGKGAQKGVLITTSDFSKDARATASQAGQFRLVLINGEELTTLMLRFGIGVRLAQTVELKRVDLDYFDDGQS